MPRGRVARVDGTKADVSTVPTKVTTNGTKRRAPPRTISPAATKRAKVKTVDKANSKVASLTNPLPTPPLKPRPGLQLFVWGTNEHGQIGFPDYGGYITKPRKHPWADKQMKEGAFGNEKGAGLIAVAGGGMHSLLLDENGTIWSAGVNDNAALGRPTKKSSTGVDDSVVFQPLQSLVDEGFRAVQITSGDSVNAAINEQGQLKVWGCFRYQDGQLVFSDHSVQQSSPISVLKLPRKAGDSEKVSSIASGGNHLLVLTTHGSVYSWGVGEDGQLGRKVLARHKTEATVPQRVVLGVRTRKAVVIGVGQFTSFAVDEAGNVWGWGMNSMGHTGTGYDSLDDLIVELPAKVIGLSSNELGGSERVVQIAGGDHHTLFLTSSGKLYACGRCDDGQLGLRADHPALQDNAMFVSEPVLVDFTEDDPIVEISAGPRYSMAITKGGALYSWGQGASAELGVGDEDIEVVRTPQMIVRREGGSWTAMKVSCGGQHVLGLFQNKMKE